MAYIKRRRKRISNLNVDRHRPLGDGWGREEKESEKENVLTVSLHLSALELKEEIA